MCFKMGIPLQGILHDLSKYSIKELSIAKYYDGSRSPHALARDELGCSPSWMHHYHKNKHHWQFWLDMEDWPDKVTPVKMPYKYVVEMFCDFVGAGKAYEGGTWSPSTPWGYWKKACEGKRLMHKDSEMLLKYLLWELMEFGMDRFVRWYRSARKSLKSLYDAGELLFLEGGSPNCPPQSKEPK